MLDQYKKICINMARDFRVNSEIHPQDFIFQYCINHPGFESNEDAIHYYFSDGANSAEKLKKILIEICGYGEHNIRLLEFASGYGMVTRHLKQSISFSSITACDIHPKATRFLKNQLSVDAVISSHRPHELSIVHKYDVVFALSFFSHMPKIAFTNWLKKLATLLNDKGFLIFTTHGLVSWHRSIKHRRFFYRWLSKFTPFVQKYHNFDEDGFYFHPTAEQKDIDSAEYGTTAVKPHYVIERIEDIPGLKLHCHHEGYWWDHQDLYVAQLSD